MRKLLFASLTLLSSSIFAQTESFNSGAFPPTTPFTMNNPVGIGNALQGQVRWMRSDNSILAGQSEMTGLVQGYDGTGNCAILNSFQWCCGWQAELIMNSVNLSGYTNPRLKFYVKHPDGEERISIDVDNGSGYTTLMTFTTNYANWTPIYVDLSAYGGNTVNIRITGTENGSSGSTNVGIDEIVIEEQVNMTLQSSDAFQEGCNMYQGGNDQVIMRVEVVTQGSLSPLSLTQMGFSTNGTTLPSDITAEKLYYTGTDPNFNTGTLVGSNSATGFYTINNAGLTLQEGTNYFWLTYDIPYTATLGNTFDAECQSITIGSTVSPTTMAPTGALTLNNANVFYVTNTNNSGAGSLRAALNAADAYGCDAIVDARGVTGTINHLTGINLFSDHHITLLGPGADKLSVSGLTVNFIYKAGTGLFTMEGLKIENFNVTTGAVYAPNGGIEIKYCWFDNHSGLPFYVPGGDAWVYNTTFSNNSSNNYAGAIYFPSSGSLYIYNSTFYNNNCVNSAGAIYNPYGSLYLKGCTFKDNTSAVTQGGGAIRSLGYLDAYNTTFDNNQCPGGGKDVSGNLYMNNSHISSTNGYSILGGSNNLIGISGGLVAMAQNGGPTPTCALQGTSQLVNSGGTTPTKDQRDYCRVNTPDVGAFEFFGTAAAVVTADLTLSTNELCSGDDLILTATTTGTGGAANYYWTVNGAVVGNGTSNTFTINESQLNNGDFIGFIVDPDLSTFCSAPQYVYSLIQFITVHDDPSLVATATSTSICEGDQITLSASCNSSYTLSWNNGVTNNNPFIPVSTGTTDYIVTATDGTCSDADTISVIVNALPDPVFSIQNSTCGQSNGSVTITSIPNTTGPYTYQWTNGDTGATADTLESGLYLVSITTGAGCENDATVYINDANGPSIVNAVETEVTCPGGSNGAIDITATGGTGTLTYSWNNGATTEDISNLSAGVYDVTVTDQSGCQTSDLFLISAPLPMVITHNNSQPTCGNPDGSITVNVNGGNGGYTYLWNPTAQTTATATGLTSGIYQVTVTDQLGCTKTKTIVLNNGNGPSIDADSIINVACGGTGGEIYVTVTGGSTPYTYLWSNSDTNEDITGLAPGNYSLLVTDGGGCTGSFDADIETDLPSIQDICMVTVDTLTQTNLVIWEKPLTANGVAYYNIYREGSVPGDYLVIDTVQYNSLSQYTDPIANPQIRAWRYKISAVDSCGFESELSMEHKTIHLAANLGVGNVVNLSWGDYEGFAYPTYYINRYTSSTGWEVLDSLPNTLSNWTDATPPVGTPDYAITINAPSGCNATRVGVNTSRSNVKNQPVSNPTAIAENSISEIQVYPNPAVNDVFITIGGNKTGVYSLKVYNLLGELMTALPMNGSQFRLDTRNFASGVYTITVSDEHQSIATKIVITR